MGSDPLTDAASDCPDSETAALFPCFFKTRNATRIDHFPVVPVSASSHLQEGRKQWYLGKVVLECYVNVLAVAFGFPDWKRFQVKVEVAPGHISPVRRNSPIGRRPEHDPETEFSPHVGVWGQGGTLASQDGDTGVPPEFKVLCRQRLDRQQH